MAALPSVGSSTPCRIMSIGCTTATSATACTKHPASAALACEPSIAPRVGSKNPLAAPPDEGVPFHSYTAGNEPRLTADRQYPSRVGHHQTCHAEEERPGVAAVRAATPARVRKAGAPHPRQHPYPHDSS